MTISQTLLNAKNRADSARTALMGLPSEQTARRAMSDIDSAIAYLREAKAEARVKIAEAKERDRDDQRERAITRDSWLRLAGEIVA